jgi:hypothetical protein
MSYTVNPATLQQQYQQLGDRPGDALEVAAYRLTLSAGLILAPVLMRLIRFLGIDMLSINQWSFHRHGGEYSVRTAEPS